MRPFDKEHLEFLHALNKHTVEYLIIGGHAAIYHGVNRNTGDLDILIEPSAQNGKKLLAALQSLGLSVPIVQDHEWNSNLVLSFGLEPNAIDIMNYAPGLTFDEVFKNAIKIKQSNLSIPILDIRDLLRNKKSLKRTGEKSHLDKYDIEILKKILSRKK